MGTLDEHWCNVCKKKLDKKKDKYVEFELVNLPFQDKTKAWKSKGIVCENCVDADHELKKAIELIIKAGNPLFKPIVSCESLPECETYEESKNTKVNCGHIAVIGDKIYCKRSHVGRLTLPREKAEVRREEAQIMKKMLEEYIKDPDVKKLLKTAVLEKHLLKPIYTPPSVVVEAVSEHVS